MTLRVICAKLSWTRSGPTYTDGWSGRSADVMTAFTPGRASAWEVSMDRMRAWAWGLRRIPPTSIPGSEWSAANRARPVTLSTPSGRTGRDPTHLNPLPLSWFTLPPFSVAALVR